MQSKSQIDHYSLRESDTSAIWWQFLIGIFILSLEVISLPVFFHYIQNRPGVVLQDPFLAFIPMTQVNLTYLIVPLTYLPILIFFILNIRNIFCLLHTLIAYEMLLALRLVCIFVAPLEAPVGNIPLADIFAYGSQVVTKDLYYSGHTASLFLFFLLAKNKSLKTFIGIDLIILIVLLMSQRAHYSIDYISAPFFSFGCYYLAYRIIDILNGKVVMD